MNQNTKQEEWIRVLTKEMFIERVADKYFGEDGGQSIATSDGKIAGNFGGQELSGTWDWKDTYFARTSTLGDMDLGYDEIVIEVTDTKMKLILERGQGPSVVYDKKS